MKKIVKKSFANQELCLDNREYVDCTFQACLLTYSAKGSFRFHGNTVSDDCRFEVRGRAANTITALQDLYDLGDWGRTRVMATLSEISGKSGMTAVSEILDQSSSDSLGYLVPED